MQISRNGRLPSSRLRRGLAGGLAAGLVAGVLTALGAAGPAFAASQAEVSPVAAQTIDDIGVSGAWWVDDLVNFAPAVQQNVAAMLFGSSGLALSAYRYNIGGGGTAVTNPVRAAATFQTSPGSYDWSRDPGGRLFLQYASDYGVPDLVGFVNSAPAVWTSNAQSCGGAFVAGDEAAYATYLADVVGHFAAQGIHLNYLSPMNEPQVSESACGQEGMTVATAERDDIVRAAGAELAARGLSTGISADESSKLASFNSEAPTWLAASGTAQYVANLAHHTYDNPSEATMLAGMNVGRSTGKKTWASEICCFNGIGSGWGQQYDPTITSGLAMSDIIYKDFTATGDSAFHWWVALASTLGSCVPTTSSGCASAVNSTGWNDGLIYYDPSYATNGNQTLYPTKRYYALGQYSKFVRPGSVRYAVTGAPSGVEASAYSYNGQWIVVANNLNTSSASLSLHFNAASNVSAAAAYRTSATENLASVSLPSVASGLMSATLPAQSITTYVLDQTGGGSSSVTSPLVGAGSAKCLDVPGASTTNSTQVEIYTCNGGANQSWTFSSSAELRVYGTKCLEAYQQGTANNTAVDIYDCNGGANQKWRMNSDGTVIGEQSGKCLDVTGASSANGALLILYTCTAGTNEVWQRP